MIEQHNGYVNMNSGYKQFWRSGEDSWLKDIIYKKMLLHQLP